jgi:hypothetical protein
MVYPKFIPNSFWNYTEACELVGAKYPAAPLGLITVAALCPKEWKVSRCAYFFHGLYWPGLLLKLLRRPRSLVIPPPSESSRGLHAFIGSCFDLEARQGWQDQKLEWVEYVCAKNRAWEQLQSELKAQENGETDPDWFAPAFETPKEWQLQFCLMKGDG